MAELAEIKGIGQSSLELLKATGVLSVSELATHDLDALVAELQRANEILAISKRPPSKKTVLSWITEARVHAGDPEHIAVGAPSTETNPPFPVNYEGNPEVAEMLATSPCAIPLPGKILMENGLGVSDVPAGLLLNRYSGDLDVRIDDPATPIADVPARRNTANIELISNPNYRQFDASSAIPMVRSNAETPHRAKSKPAQADDRGSLIDSSQKETKSNTNHESRSFVQGVLHPHPWRLRTGAVFSLLLIIDLPLAFLASLLLMLSRELPGKLPWVSEWFLVFPLSLPVISLGYLIWGYSGKCLICRQKLFVHKAALKHIKSHRFPGMGFVVPLSIHLLLFAWFRCSSCGTPIRLKK